jgi:hypothetical protein
MINKSKSSLKKESKTTKSLLYIGRSVRNFWVSNTCRNVLDLSSVSLLLLSRFVLTFEFLIENKHCHVWSRNKYILDFVVLLSFFKELFDLFIIYPNCDYCTPNIKSKDWLARNQNNVSEWSDMSTRGLLFQWASTIRIQRSVLV